MKKKSRDRQNTGRASGVRESWLVGLLLTLFIAFALWAADHDSVTVDEFSIVPSGYAKLLNPGELNWLNSVNPPLIQGLLASPWLASRPTIDPSWWAQERPELRWSLGHQFMGANVDQYDQLFFQSRLVAIALGVLLLLYAWRWSRWLFGPPGGLVTLALCALSPTLLAHSHLATVDVGAAAFLTMAAFHFHRVLAESRPLLDRHTVALAVAYAAAVGAKYTALLLAPVFLTLLVTLAVREEGGRGLRRAGGIATMVGVCCVLMLWALYGFADIGHPVRDISALARLLPESVLHVVGGLPVPLPEWFPGGMATEWSRVQNQLNPFYFLGLVSHSAHPAYFVAALVMKEPVGHLVILAAAACLAALRPVQKGPRFWWLPAPLGLWVLGCFSFAIGSNLGVRYVLFVLVCGYIAAGRLGQEVREIPKLRHAVLVVMAISAVSVSRVGPHFLSYFNEMVGGPEGGRTLLSDSNVDWGQDLKALKEVMTQRGYDRVWLSYFGPVSPVVYGISGAPLALRPPGVGGIVAVSVHHLNGIAPFDAAEVDRVRPYRNRIPVARAGYSLLIFDDR